MDKSTLLAYLPSYYRTSKIIDNLNETNAKELTLFKDNLTNVLNQFFIDSSDFTLERWENEFGIEVDNSYSTEFRRSRIKSKSRGQGTVTFKLVKNVAESFTNGTVAVIEDNSNYQFTIKFISTLGIPPNLQDLKDAIENIKPAHLAVNFQFTYTTWGQVKSLTWAQAKTGSWAALKTRVIV